MGSDYVLQVFIIVFQHLGNDPQIFSLYFTCWSLYGFYQRWRSASGYVYYKDCAIAWNMDLENCLNSYSIKAFFKRVFDGFTVMDSFEKSCLNY